MFPQEAESKYKNIITGYEVDDISKGKICSSMQSLDKENSQIGVAFSFHKVQKDNEAILKGDLINSELGDILSVTTEVKTEYPSFGLSDRDDHVETMDRQDRRNRAIKCLDDGGDCDDRDDHMETSLKQILRFLDTKQDCIRTRHGGYINFDSEYVSLLYTDRNMKRILQSDWLRASLNMRIHLKLDYLSRYTIKLLLTESSVYMENIYSDAHGPRISHSANKSILLTSYGGHKEFGLRICNRAFPK